MTTAISYVQATRNTRLDNAWDQMNNGFIKLYSGSIPANADAALSGNTLLSTLTFAATAFAAASAGSKTANAITQDSDAVATGVATFARCTKSDGTVIAQVTVGTAGEGIILATTTINQHDVVQVSSFVPAEAA